MHYGAAGGADLLDLHARLHQGVAAETFRQAVGVDITGVGKEFGEFPDPGSGVRSPPPTHHWRLETSNRSRSGRLRTMLVITGANQAQVISRLDGLQGGFGIEIAMDHHRSAHPQHPDARQVDAAHVIHRPDDQELVPRRLLEGHGLVHRLPVETIVLVDHTLRMIGRPGRVHQSIEIAAVSPYGIGPVVGLRKRADIGLCGRIDMDNAGQAGGEVREFVIDQHQFDTGMVVDIGDFGRREPVVDRQEYRADMARSQHKIEEPGTVFHHQGNNIAFRNTFPTEPGTGRECTVEEVGIGDARAVVDDGQVVWPLCGVKSDEGGQVMHGRASKRAVMPLYQNWTVAGRRPDINSEPEEATILTVNADTLSKQITEIYRAWGMAEDVIEITVRNMVEADLRGIDSHGAGMLPTYNLRRKNGVMIPTGELTVVREFAATALLDAGNALGHYATTKAMEMACDRAKEFGVGVVTVRRSNHYGAAGVYSTMAADRGMIGMCMTGSSQPAVLPTFAKEPRFSTNPIAVAAPGLKNEHFSLDMATSTVAVGKLNIARRAGKGIPLGWASDETGAPTTDPVAALNAVPKRLSPIGGSRELGSHKGYGLGLVVEDSVQRPVGFLHRRHRYDDKETGRDAEYRSFLPRHRSERLSGGRRVRSPYGRIDGLDAGYAAARSGATGAGAGRPRTRSPQDSGGEGIPMTDTLVKEVREVAEEAGAPLLIGN